MQPLTLALSSTTQLFSVLLTVRCVTALKRLWKYLFRNSDGWERRTPGSTTARPRTTRGTRSVTRRWWKSVSVQTYESVLPQAESVTSRTSRILGFYPNSRVCMKMSGLSVWHKIQNQSSGLQTLCLVNFTELSIDFSFVYKRKASLIPENRHVDLRRTLLKSILPSVSDDVDILGIFLKTFGVVLFFFCLAACICHSLKRGCFHNKSHSENKWVKGHCMWNLWRNFFLFTDLLLFFLATTGRGPIMGLSMATQMR